MSNTTDLIDQYNAIQSQIDSLNEQVGELEEQANALIDQMPTKYYVQGYGQEGVYSYEVLFVADSEQECIDWMKNRYPLLQLSGNGVQFVRSELAYKAAAGLKSCTPVSKAWQYVSEAMSKAQE